MKNAINTTVWHPFVVGEIFSQVRGKEKAPKQNLDGNTPLIQETNSNNGFDRYVKPTKVIKGNSITVSINYAQNVFYQPKDYCASVNIVSLHNESLNPYNGKFIATVLANAHKKYTYTNKISKNRLNAEIIRLPAITKLTPDYQKLETFAGGTNMSNIDTSSWKDFKVCDIFLCETTKGIPSKNDLEVGDIPYITRSSENNGRAQTCGNINNIVKGNCITIGAEGFTAFYQKDDFVAGNKVYSLRIKNYEMNEILGLYLASELNSFTENYSFNNARILEKIKKETIKLPVTETYEPDWQYMEEYMKNIESEVTSKIDKFQMILGNEKHKIDTQKWGGV